MIVGSLAELIYAAKVSPVTATQFCDWTTTDEQVACRIQEWRKLSGSVAESIGLDKLIDLALAIPLPAVNSGIFHVQRGAKILEEWDPLTCQGKDAPMPDELSLQFLLLRHTHSILGGHFNCHPFASNVPDVRIWHFAGAVHLRHAAAWNLWLPKYRDCVTLNLAKIETWSRVDLPPEFAQ
jgi:hypothetical protein